MLSDKDQKRRVKQSPLLNHFLNLLSQSFSIYQWIQCRMDTNNPTPQSTQCRALQRPHLAPCSAKPASHSSLSVQCGLTVPSHQLGDLAPWTTASTRPCYFQNHYLDLDSYSDPLHQDRPICPSCSPSPCVSATGTRVLLSSGLMCLSLLFQTL